jgi:hypothetical protein
VIHSDPLRATISVPAPSSIRNRSPVSIETGRRIGGRVRAIGGKAGRLRSGRAAVLAVEDMEDSFGGRAARIAAAGNLAMSIPRRRVSRV